LFFDPLIALTVDSDCYNDSTVILTLPDTYIPITVPCKPLAWRSEREIILNVADRVRGSSRYLRLLAAKADECLQVRIRGSLSESESSNEMAVIEEIIDDEDDVNYEQGGNDAIFYDPNTSEEVQDLGAVVQLSGAEFSEEPFGLNGFSPAKEAHNFPFSS
jgi:hypothetical protein